MDLAKHIEHTCLSADATADRIARLCDEALEFGFVAVCVAPSYVRLAEQRLRDSDVRVVSVAGFPLGNSTAETKSDEARRAIDDGASETDMVMAIGQAIAGDWSSVGSEISAVRRAIGTATLKVILETGLFDERGIAMAAEVSVTSGADFVKTCTGYGPRGVTSEDVRLLKEVVGNRANIKASGGVRHPESARRLIEAGATRLGTSAGVDIVRRTR